MIATLLLDLDDVYVRLLASQMVFAILVVHALGNVVEAPVHTIQEKVYIECIDTGMSHLPLHTSGPDITGILRFLAVSTIPVLPGIAEMAAQHQLSELIRLTFAKEVVLQVRRAICLFIHQTYRVLGILLCQTSVTTMQLHTTVDAQVVMLRTAKEFGTARTGPAITSCIAHRRACIDVDAARLFVILVTEEIPFVGDHREDRQLFQALDDLRSQHRVVCHLRIHLVVGNGRAFKLGIPAPC